MRVTLKPVVPLLLPALLVASPAFAGQTRIVDATVINQALVEKAESENAQRAVVRRVLDREDVRQLAARMGLSVAQADAAVSSLSGAELADAARHAGAVEAAQAGGATTVVISLTTLLLILIIVILLAR